MNCSTFLNQNTRGVHLNFEGHFTSPTNSPMWLNLLQRHDWPRRGFVVWDAELRVVTRLYAGYALELLEQMRVNDTWKSSRFVISTPTYKISSETVDGSVSLENKVELPQPRQSISLIF